MRDKFFWKGADLTFSLFGPKKYIYLSVCFAGSRKSYYYLTKNRYTKINDVVMVPVYGKEDQPAIVADVIICTEKDAPYPLHRTRMITGPANWRNRRLFKGVDMRPRIVNRTVREKIDEEDDDDGLEWIDKLEMLDAIFDDD